MVKPKTTRVDLIPGTEGRFFAPSSRHPSSVVALNIPGGQPGPHCVAREPGRFRRYARSCQAPRRSRH